MLFDKMIIIYLIFLITVQVISGDRTSNEEIKALMQIDNKCNCGRVPIYENKPERIVNGEEAEEHEFPWVAAITYNGGIHCGGSLINDRYILSAAHCFKNFSHVKEKFSVFLGSHSLPLKEVPTYHIEDIIIHESYKVVGHKSIPVDDIALIKLRQSVQYSTSIQPICLPTSRENNAENSSMEATVAGWGELGELQPDAKSLMKTTVEVMSVKQCLKKHGPKFEKSMLCAFGRDTDVCSGDSGGPLFWNTSSRFEQIGIVSYGTPCIPPYMPSIYTRVTNYLDWIVSRTKDALYCNHPAF